jgi:hypothetical protein
VVYGRLTANKLGLEIIIVLFVQKIGHFMFHQS